MSISLVGPLSTGACVGADGAAAGSVTSTSPIRGQVMGMYIQYVGDDPATTDVTVKAVGTSPMAPTYNLMVVTDAATDKWLYPRVLVQDTAGSNIAGEYTAMFIHDLVNVTVAGANTGDVINVWLLIENEGR